jgi:hypothetical protein
MTTRRSAVLWLTVAVVATVFAACEPSRQRRVPVSASSVSPAPGAASVPRRVEMRVVFNRDVDPWSINSSTCRIAMAGAGSATSLLPPPILIPTYDAATRLLTLRPLAPLAPLTKYRVDLTSQLRVPTGESFARPIQWDLTTDANPVFEFGVEFDYGTLLACEPSRSGGALAVFNTPGDSSLRLRRFTGSEWLPPSTIGISEAVAADVADDATGRVVVAAITRTGEVRVAASSTGVFPTPENLGTTGSEHLDVDTGNSGHILLATYDGMLSGTVRSRIPGIGWAAPFTILGGLPHVHLNAAGDGIAVAAISESLGGGTGGTACWRFCVDALGNWSQCDPTLPPTSVSPPIASRASFRDDRVLLAPTTYPLLGTGLFERRSGVWADLGVLLGSDPEAISIAQSASDYTAATTIQAGLRPVLRQRLEQFFHVQFLGSDDQPAPNNPTTGVAITDDLSTHAIWTAKVDSSDGAFVRLMASSALFLGAPADPVVVDGPFAPEDLPIQKLRVVPLDLQRAIAVWSRGGTVRYAICR